MGAAKSRPAESSARLKGRAAFDYLAANLAAVNDAYRYFVGYRCLSDFSDRGRVLGGGPVREYYLNHFLLPLLPADASASLVSWFSTANSMQEWLLAFAVSVNLNAILLPLLYVLGVFVIQVSSWVAKKDIQLKRDSIR